MAAYDAVLFDFDGVLADTEPIHFACWADIVRGFGIELDWDTYREQGIGRDDRDLLRFLAAQAVPPLDPERLMERYPEKKREFLRQVLAEPPIGQATRELVRSLSDYKLAVVTSSDVTEVEPVLECAGVRGFFAALVCARDCEMHKPDPEPYLIAARRLQADHPLVVEDSAAGLASGRAAGFDVLHVPEPGLLPELLRARLGQRG